MRIVRYLAGTNSRFCSLSLFTAWIVASTAGCESVNMKRFESTTRIDVLLNPGWQQFEEPFESQVARLRERRTATCTDPDAIRRVYAHLTAYEEGWSNLWAIPPESPPVELIFHNQVQWLGTLDLYPAALGCVHNLIRRIDAEVSAEILRTLCDCADGSSYRAERQAPAP